MRSLTLWKVQNANNPFNFLQVNLYALLQMLRVLMASVSYLNPEKQAQLQHTLVRLVSIDHLTATCKKIMRKFTLRRNTKFLDNFKDLLGLL